MNADELMWAMRTIATNRVLNDPKIKKTSRPAAVLRYVSKHLGSKFVWFDTEEDQQAFDRAVLQVLPLQGVPLEPNDLASRAYALADIVKRLWQARQGGQEAAAAATPRPSGRSPFGNDMGAFVGTIYGVVMVLVRIPDERGEQ